MNQTKSDPPTGPRITRTDAEWQAQLTPAQFHVMRRCGTERAGSGPHLDEHREGIYACAGCDEQLFASGAKFDSGTGWPSFFEPLTQNAVSEHEDRGLFSRRTEIRCAACGSHLGHVFTDGPKPTGLRYCMNGVALNFTPGPGGSDSDGSDANE